MDIKLIIGLGNPGKQYINNRHNIGFKIIDELVLKYGFWPNSEFFDNLFKAEVKIGFGKLVILAKPNTFMNNSGESVKLLIDKLNLNPSNILVVYDDITLPLGTIRLRETGSSGGHNGIESIIKSLDTENFNRLKIGIGYPVDMSIIDYVLSDFSTEDYNQMINVIKYTEFIIDNILSGLIIQGNTFKLN